MIDQLIIGNLASYDDFEANVKERAVSAPKKKSIKETVPFSNETYDFTAINGEIYWEERTLEYVFEITANTPEELEEKKQLFVSWIMNVMKEELHDPFVRGYHFVATYDDMSIDDSEVEKTTITVKFTAYPYMIANTKKTHEIDFEANEEVTAKIINDSSHRITPTLIVSAPLSITMNGKEYTVNAGTFTDASFMLAVGANAVTVKSSGTAGTLKIEFYEEVF